jgi:hypothetical protein
MKEGRNPLSKLVLGKGSKGKGGIKDPFSFGGKKSKVKKGKKGGIKDPFSFGSGDGFKDGNKFLKNAAKKAKW